MNLTLAAAASLLFAFGTYLVLHRELTRIILGLAVLAHGANLFILASAERGEPAFVGDEKTRGLLDPLPQAFILTAIVITFGVTTFLLGLAYRSWVLTRDDQVPDDVEDRRVARRRKPTEVEADFASVEADPARSSALIEEVESSEDGPGATREPETGRKEDGG